jgi:hypothetical protein
MPPPPEVWDDDEEVAVEVAVDVADEVTELAVEPDFDDVTDVDVVPSPPAPPDPASSPQARRARGAETKSQPAARRARISERNEAESMRLFSRVQEGDGRPPFLAQRKPTVPDARALRNTGNVTRSVVDQRPMAGSGVIPVSSARTRPTR